MSKAAQLVDGDQEAEVPSQDAVHPDQESRTAVGAQLDGTEEAVQDPPTQEERMVDPAFTSEVPRVEEEDGPAGSGVLII